MHEGYSQDGGLDRASIILRGGFAERNSTEKWESEIAGCWPAFFFYFFCAPGLGFFVILVVGKRQRQFENDECRSTGRQIYSSESFGKGFLCVATLPDGRHCLTSGKDGLV